MKRFIRSMPYNDIKALKMHIDSYKLCRQLLHCHSYWLTAISKLVEDVAHAFELSLMINGMK